ncbi:MAG: hypothetical protein ACE5G7_01115 [Candidatus Hydrothermarchaeaceae archaeon]
MLDRAISKYHTFLVLGIFIVASGLLLGAYREVNQKTLSDEAFAGRTDTELYRASLKTEALLARTVEQWVFVGLAMLKLGIGFAIATIVMNLRDTGTRSREAFNSIGEKMPVERIPFFARAFAPLMMVGFLIVLLAFFPFTIWWDLNATKLIDMQLDGLTGTSEYHRALELDKLLDHLIKPGKMIGTGFLILGISMGLASIIMNLRTQSQVMPNKMIRIIARSKGDKTEREEMALPEPPVKLLVLPALGFLFVLSGTFPLSIIRSLRELVVLRGEAAGIASSQALLSARTSANVLEHFIEPWIFLGLSLMLVGIGILLLNIIGSLRDQRSNFGSMLGKIMKKDLPPVEPPLWTTKVVYYLLGVGLLIVLFNLFPLMFMQIGSERGAQAFAFIGMSDSVEYHDATKNVRILEEIIKPLKFIGLSTIMLGIGFSLVTIVINLKLTGIQLPGIFSRVLEACKGKEPEEFKAEEIPEPLSLAPWKLLAPLIIGVLMVYSATFPLSYWRVQSTQAFLAEELVGNTGSERWQQAVLSERLLEHAILPWKIFGIGLIFFAIGKFFATIVGFVTARKMVVTDGVRACVQYVKEPDK